MDGSCGTVTSAALGGSTGPPVTAIATDPSDETGPFSSPVNSRTSGVGASRRFRGAGAGKGAGGAGAGNPWGVLPGAQRTVGFAFGTETAGDPATAGAAGGVGGSGGEGAVGGGIVPSTSQTGRNCAANSSASAALKGDAGPDGLLDMGLQG